MNAETYVTRGGIAVQRTVEDIPLDGAIEPLIEALDSRRGVLLASSYEYPGRYTRWDIGLVDPPLQVVSRGRAVSVAALNARGAALIPFLTRALAGLPSVAWTPRGEVELLGVVAEPEAAFTEEERSKQPSVFSVLRALIELFASPEDPHLGLFGAFGYDLAFQFEPIRLRLPRPARQREVVLYVPDEILVVDHRRGQAMRRRYDFEVDGRTTAGLPREGQPQPYRPAKGVERECDHDPGEYAAGVRLAHEAFRRGDLFEVVPGQMFMTASPSRPSELFRRLRESNPAPYGFLINLGDGEYLVGASPEMYVRVEGDRVETCPISGTIARGQDPLSDAVQIQRLLNSQKDEAELTMCTDVDRNDKSRICRAGSVRVIGRRQIEMYSRLIHTVDHVEGRLRDGFDALDAFLAHTWAVTVTGAPKAWAMQFIEDHERSPRAWYGGAVGKIGFDGGLNTGLTLRTIRVKDGRAEVRVGATLLWDSDPAEEEAETELKAAAFLDAIREPRSLGTPSPAVATDQQGRRIVLVDHLDSFVHTLANYFRQTGADVITLRTGFPLDELAQHSPDLVVLSPGPGRPADFDMDRTIGAAIDAGIPLFGVCLGLQGIVEHFGGSLGQLDVPMHGKPSTVRVTGGRLLAGLPAEFRAGRYHSLYARIEDLPEALEVGAMSDDGVVMAVEHRRLPVAAVQFHPESIMSLDGEVGLRLVGNVVQRLGTAG
jgi:anthranilate synthase